MIFFNLSLAENRKGIIKSCTNAVLIFMEYCTLFVLCMWNIARSFFSLSEMGMGVHDFSGDGGDSLIYGSIVIRSVKT